MKFIQTAIFLCLCISVTAQYTEPSVAISTFLEGISSKNVETVQRFVNDNIVYQRIITDKNRNNLILTYRKDSFLYAVSTIPKDSCSETYQLGVSTKDGVLATVWTNYRRTLKKGEIICGNRVFSLIFLEKGWQIVQGLETQFYECPAKEVKIQHITLPSPFFQN